MTCPQLPPPDDSDHDDAPALCPTCGGDGWCIVGLDYDVEDGVNGPFDGETERCPNCGGTGRAAD
jgi:ribosomal protein S27AE